MLPNRLKRTTGRYRSGDDARRLTRAGCVSYSSSRGLCLIFLSETKFHVKPLPHARIPIVKLSLDPSPGLPLGIACDIGFENRLALENTRLLMCYAMIDPARVRTMVLFREFDLSHPYLHVPLTMFRVNKSKYGANVGQ